MKDRYYWGDVLAELRRVLIRAENDVQKKMSAQRAGVQAGIWIEQLITTHDGGLCARMPWAGRRGKECHPAGRRPTARWPAWR